MQDVILLHKYISYIYFWVFMVKKLDAFLENNWNEQEHILIHVKQLENRFFQPINGRQPLRCSRDLRKTASRCLYPYFQRRR